MNWTHGICGDCWNERNLGVEPVRIKPEFAVQERCCYCGKETTSGIYIRADPRTLPYPTKEED
jgi:hypothetical protein